MITRSNAIAAAIAACVVFLALPAAAVDGEILINQAKVDAGGITPGDAPGFPATLSKPGRYKLSGNLKVPAGKNGIEVTQRDVTIDLNGFTISSGGAQVGVYASGLSGLRIMNGTITGFLQGGVFGGPNGLVENLRIVSSGNGVTMTNGRIRNNTIVNGFHGISCHTDCLIEQNVVTGNTQDGMNLTGGVALGNVIVGNGRFGIANSVGQSRSGYGNNILFGNGSASVSGSAPVQLHPNVCEPACP